MYRFYFLCFWIGTAACAPGFGQTDPVPPEYQDIYANLNTQISAFDSAVRANWDGSKFPVAYAPQLEAASSAEYTTLLSPNYYTGVVLSQLEELQSLGAQGVKVWVSFPILYEPFYAANPAQYQSFVNFYRQLASDIHSRGMKLIVESTVANPFPGDNAVIFTQYYQTLSWTDYMNARAQCALAVAQLMQPDYLSLVTEPDSEASYTGQMNAGTVAGSTELLQTMLDTLQSGGITGVSLGAGAGTWIGSLTKFVQSFASTSIQYIDVHIYPLNDDDLTNALTVAALAHTAEKQVAVSAAWDFKVRDSELGVLTLTQVSARDPFSFWAPVDTAFFQALADYSNFEQALFISPFWSHYFFAYLDYATAGSLAEGPVIISSQNASWEAMLTSSVSPTGLAWLRLSLPAPDTIPPVTPMAPIATGVYATTVTLAWTATTDNIGVAGYNLYRNGTLVTRTSLLSYTDEGAPGTEYAYTLAAFDASGNASAQSPPLWVWTKNAIPPTVPTRLTARASSISQIDLFWAPSTSQAGIAGYEIYRGSSLESMSPFATTPTNAYFDFRVSPSLTYYYAVLAFDRSGNESSLSLGAAATALQESAPSTPGQPALVLAAYNQISLAWPVSTSSLGIGGYLIFRGTSPSALTQISNTILPAFADNHVMPATTYYYAVASYDINGLFSSQSPVGTAATILETAPTAPAQTTAHAVSFNQAALSWTASTSVAGVGGYLLYRATSPNNLSLLSDVKTTAYVDRSVAPSTAYYYAVVSYDIYGLHSAQFSQASVLTPREPAPTAPSKVTAVPASYNQVTISWAASTSVAGVGGYAVYRGTSPASLSAIAGVKTNAYTDGTAIPSKTYYYAVAAYDVYGLYSADSSLATAVTPAEPAPTVPTQLAVLAAGYNQVALSWTASTSASGVLGYAVYRGNSPAGLSAIGTSRTTVYTDAKVSPSATYYYAVAAYDIYGAVSAQSVPVSAVTPPAP